MMTVMDMIHGIVTEGEPVVLTLTDAQGTELCSGILCQPGVRSLAVEDSYKFFNWVVIDEDIDQREFATTIKLTVAEPYVHVTARSREYMAKKVRDDFDAVFNLRTVSDMEEFWGGYKKALKEYLDVDIDYDGGLV